MINPLHFHQDHWPEVWASVCSLLEEEIIANQFHAWIRPLSIFHLIEKEKRVAITLSAPNDFSAQWVKDHYHSSLVTAFSEVMGQSCQLDFFVATPESPPQTHSHFLETTQQVPPSDAFKTTSSIRSPASLGGKTDSLDPRYTFDNFVVGPSNQFAFASSVAVAGQPTRQYNPLFLYSPPGLGKTHLLHAIGNYSLAHDGQLRVAYVSAERFVNELIDSLQHRRMAQFRAKYRDSYDMILMDDIHFIAGKISSEEEFFHTFNSLYSLKRQIVVTSDRPPKEIENLEERVRTRFEWGLIANISPPELETRVAILKIKAERDDIYLPDDVAHFLASQIQSNVRELEGILIRLQAQASLTGSEISLEMAKNESRSALISETSPLHIDSIQNSVAKFYHLKVSDLRSPLRIRAFSFPRQMAMYLIRKHTGMGFKEIGLLFGKKDHTTVLHAYSKLQALESVPDFQQTIESIEKLFL